MFNRCTRTDYLWNFKIGSSAIVPSDVGKPCKLSSTQDELALLSAGDEVEFVIDHVDAINGTIRCLGPGDFAELRYSGSAPALGRVHLTGSATIGLVASDTTFAAGKLVQTVLAVDTTNQNITVYLR